MNCCNLTTPFGPLVLEEEGGALCQIQFGSVPAETDSPLLREAKRQPKAYFAGELREFSLPLAPKGTPFQQAVWQALQHIPYGQTRSYAEIAREIGCPNGCRAVGMANHRNPLPIVIPCHRVVGKDGTLTGYAGGLQWKEGLLRLEGVL